MDERFQSFNIEMIEVTGGRFWKSYRDIDAKASARSSAASAGAVPAGMDASLYEYRPPINLANPRLRALAAALGPAYVRVSGTWANTTYFHDAATPPPTNPPAGFGGVLSRPQWQGVIDFARAAGVKIVTSFATGEGTRDVSGLWTPTEANKILTYTKSIGGSIAAAEFMNEPTYAEMGGAPKGYDAAAYGRDIAVFRSFMKKTSPETIILGPGGVGEGIPLMPIGLAGSVLNSEDILKASGPAFDGVSYHSYGATSRRCAALAINLDRTNSQSLDIPTAAERYTLTARTLTDTRIELNGSALGLGAHDELPSLASAPIKSGPVNFTPTTITFLAIPQAHNASCR